MFSGEYGNPTMAWYFPKMEKNLRSLGEGMTREDG
jgi:hypothetical protein